MFGIPIDQCVANERSARLQQQQQQHHQQHPQQSGINDDLSNDNGDSTPIFRKASHGSRTSFSSLIEGFKFDKVSIPGGENINFQLPLSLVQLSFCVRLPLLYVPLVGCPYLLLGDTLNARPTAT